MHVCMRVCMRASVRESSCLRVCACICMHPSLSCCASFCAGACLEMLPPHVPARRPTCLKVLGRVLRCLFLAPPLRLSSRVGRRTAVLVGRRALQRCLRRATRPAAPCPGGCRLVQDGLPGEGTPPPASRRACARPDGFARAPLCPAGGQHGSGFVRRLGCARPGTSPRSWRASAREPGERSLVQMRALGLGSLVGLAQLLCRRRLAALPQGRIGMLGLRDAAE